MVQCTHAHAHTPLSCLMMMHTCTLVKRNVARCTHVHTQLYERREQTKERIMQRRREGWGKNENKKVKRRGAVSLYISTFKLAQLQPSALATSDFQVPFFS
uniref:Uncharacterized protein n=1 Tax=Palpitomonas bilix TaxID=652834 RepID=A0A7S3D5B6_9EUKA